MDLGNPNSFSLAAPAKVNLFLEILGKRPDGYHEIATLMLKIDLADTLTFAQAEGDTVQLTCNLPRLSLGADNLIIKAANLLKAWTGCQHGATVHLEKNIPWAAGLGGGSSDAATALIGFNRLWETGLSQGELLALGAQLGSDVPFFLGGSAAWCTGRGEILTPVTVGQALDLVLLKPAFGLATADVYRQLRLPQAPVDGSQALGALAKGDLASIANSLHNRLQEPAFELAPGLADWYQRLQGTNPLGVLMSGSGSCLFAIAQDSTDSQRIVNELLSGFNSVELPQETRMLRCRSAA